MSAPLSGDRPALFELGDQFMRGSSERALEEANNRETPS